MEKVIIIFGPPGVGKGTQAELLAKRFRFEHLSTGVLLRKEMSSGSSLGKQIEEITSKGQLVSEDMVNKLARDFLEKNKNKTEGVILDGFPRNLAQAEVLERFLEDLDILDIKVVNLVADEHELTKRLLLRAQKEGRLDDNVTAIQKRFGIYNNITFPILNFYKTQDVEILDVNGIGKIDEIHSDIVKNIMNS